MAFAVTSAPFDQDRFETLRGPADLGRWAATILDASDVAATATDLTEARRLRWAIWNGTSAVIDGKAPSPVDRGVLNDIASKTPLRPQLEEDGSATWARPVRAGSVLSVVAGDAIEVFSGPMSARLKRCQGVNCAIPFVDTSRPGNRRWCSMERCGNRAKARTHYRQHRQEVSR
jgi:predicted RNA-binding Zn ribbon-like protein